MRLKTANGPKCSCFVPGFRTGSASPVHAKRTGLVELAFGAVLNDPRSLRAPLAPENRKKYLVPGSSLVILRWMVLSARLAARRRIVFAARRRRASRATVSRTLPGLSARVHSRAEEVETSAEATPPAKPLAEAVAGKAAASASSPARQRGRMGGA